MEDLKIECSVNEFDKVIFSLVMLEEMNFIQMFMDMEI